MSDATAMIAINALSKSYPEARGRRYVLQSIDWVVQSGSWVAVTGRSGCGKSTLLQCLALLDLPSSGEIRYQGEDLLSLSASARAHWRKTCLGYVYQSHHLLSEFSVIENVMLPLQLAGVNRATAEYEAASLLEVFDCVHCQHASIGQCSGGERQRIALARALIKRPPLLLADEPTGNLDSANALVFCRYLQQIRQQWPMTIIMVTHDHLVASHSDHCYELQDGQLMMVSQSAPREGV